MRLTFKEEAEILERVKAMSNKDLLDAATMDTDEHDERFEYVICEAEMARVELEKRLRKIGFLERS